MTKAQGQPTMFEEARSGETAGQSGKPTPKPRARRPKPQVPAVVEGKVVKMAPPPPTNMLAIIAQAAANPAVDTGKMRELLQMQKEIVAEEARIAFTEAFVAMTLPSIGRDGKIDEGITKSGRQGKKTRYATFENIMEVTEPILKAHGFALWFEPDLASDGKIIMRGHLDHVRGHGKTCAISLPLETQNKNNLQGTGSSISYGKRYAAIALLNIKTRAPEDRDLDGNAIDSEPVEKLITGPQAKQLIKAIEDSGVEIARFMEKYKIKAMHELPLHLFDEAMKALKDYGAKRASKTQA
jgi:hypothetical protein